MFSCCYFGKHTCRDARERGHDYIHDVIMHVSMSVLLLSKSVVMSVSLDRLGNACFFPYAVVDVDSDKSIIMLT